MKRLMVYLRGYERESVLAPLFKLLEAFFELLVPLVMKNIIDIGIANKDSGYIVKMGLCLLALGAVGLVSSITAQFFAAKAAVGFSAKLRQSLFDHIQSFNFTNIDRAGTSTLITRMTSDVGQVQSGVNMVLRLFLRSPIIVFGAMIMAFTIDVKSALVFVVTIPLLAVVVFGIMIWTMPLYKNVQSGLDKVLGITRENLTGVRVIRAFHQEAQEEERFREHTGALADAQMFVGKISACMNPVTYVMVNAAIIALIYIGAIQVSIGRLTQGEVVTILNYMSQILVELVKLANLIILLTKALASAGRVAAVFDIAGGEEGFAGQPGLENRAVVQAQAGALSESGRQPESESRAAAQGQIMELSELGGRLASENRADMPEQAGEPPKFGGQSGTAPYLRFDHVGLTYEGAGAETLRDIDFTVNRGETIGIIGDTGSGKTSLINLIPMFYPVTEGGIYLEGRDIAQMPVQKLRQRIGVVPQKAVLFKGSIRSNLMWGNEAATEEEMWQALDMAQAREVVEGKEGGLDAEIAQSGKNLSGGQRQRITIARALVRRPEILILDDSASALDYATDAKLRQALRTLGTDQAGNAVTVFIVSQRASSIRHADRIIVLDDGEMAGAGTHEELLAGCAVYQEIYYSQYPKQEKA